MFFLAYAKVTNLLFYIHFRYLVVVVVVLVLLLLLGPVSTTTLGKSVRHGAKGIIIGFSKCVDTILS